MATSVITGLAAAATAFATGHKTTVRFLGVGPSEQCDECGGGARHLIPIDSSYTTSFGDTWNGKRLDGENLIEVLKNRGYEFVDSLTGMNALASGRAWGLFDDSHIEIESGTF